MSFNLNIVVAHWEQFVNERDLCVQRSPRILSKKIIFYLLLVKIVIVFKIMTVASELTKIHIGSYKQPFQMIWKKTHYALRSQCSKWSEHKAKYHKIENMALLSGILRTSSSSFPSINIYYGIQTNNAITELYNVYPLKLKQSKRFVSGSYWCWTPVIACLFHRWEFRTY